MSTISAAAIKQLLGRAFINYWSTTQRVYAGFSDPQYELPSMDIWTQLLSNAPTVGYKEDVYDCEDIAMEFKAYVAKFQATSPVWQNFNAPFSVGLAVGQFSWVDNGQSLHAANFVVLEPRNGEVPTFLWLDLRLRRTFPFGEMRRGLVWVIL